jgi:hypothetical protein
MRMRALALAVGPIVFYASLGCAKEPYAPEPYDPSSYSSSPEGPPARAAGSASRSGTEGEECEGYSPIACALGGEMVCGHDSTGCRICTCNSPKPGSTFFR